jgi:hypothetical protein
VPVLPPVLREVDPATPVVPPAVAELPPVAEPPAAAGRAESLEPQGKSG